LKRFFLLLLLIVALAAFYYRQHIYVRDFRATVVRDGATEDGAQVFFSVNDDILLENDNPPMYVTLLQHDRPVALPKQLNCIHYFICYAKGEDGVAVFQEDASMPASITSEGATYKDASGKIAVVKFH
jgi:hypothetical protein